MNNKSSNKYTIINRIIIAISFVVRAVYVVITSVGDRQHDLGYATSLHDNMVNPGHLGYVEYIAKFHHLPDFDPFTLFSYFHPPFHHIIASIFVNAAHSLGIEEPATYEAIQIPTLIYSCISVVICYKILKLMLDNERKIVIPLALISFHPGLIYLSGSVNNDMLALLFSILCVYTTLLWIRNDYIFRYLILMALSIGMGIIAKMNTGIMALPMGIVMLIHLFNEYNNDNIKKVIREYCIFALISLPIGLSWTIRNIIRFRTKPGIPSGSPNQYLGNYSFLVRFGLPSSDMLSFPFYSENASYNHNVWEIMFKTSLFTEIWPVNISSVGLLLCQVLFIFSVILAIYCAVLSIIRPIRLIQNGDTITGVFLISGFLTVSCMFILFVLKYPYTCSCDFRYVAVSLLFSSIALLPYDASAKS